MVWAKSMPLLALLVILTQAPAQPVVTPTPTPTPTQGNAQGPAPAPAPLLTGELDFTEEARALFRVVACASDAPVPAGLDARVVEAHCKEMQRRYGRYRATWVDQAMPFIAQLKPAGLPTTVVYPFGGGDLISALTTYPEAREVTTMSLEHAGDPRRLKGITPRALEASLQLLRATSSGLLVANDSKTVNLMKGQRGELPGQLCFFLMGLAVHGYEPVRLRYFKLDPSGSPRYLTGEELAALEKKEAALLHKGWVSPDFSEAFDNLELVFVKKGEDPTTQARVHRHLARNLDDEHFGADAGLQAYLGARQPIVAMTKAASYLLWRDNFSRIRDYLLRHMDFMVSDSTGVPPRFARGAGFGQQAYGRFAESFLPANATHNQDFRALWRTAKPLRFRYGYLDKNLSMHMLVTSRHLAQAPAPSADTTDAGTPAPVLARPPAVAPSPATR